MRTDLSRFPALSSFNLKVVNGLGLRSAMYLGVLLPEDSPYAGNLRASGPGQPAGAGRAHGRQDAAHIVLPDQRGVPLPRPVPGRAAVRACRGAGRGLAADRLSRGGVRPVA